MSGPRMKALVTGSSGHLGEALDLPENGRDAKSGLARPIGSKTSQRVAEGPFPAA